MDLLWAAIEELRAIAKGEAAYHLPTGEIHYFYPHPKATPPRDVDA